MIDAASASGAIRLARMAHALIAGHAILWFVAAVATQPNPPLDVVEVVGWGRETAAGYAKHPPLPSWIAAAAHQAALGAAWPMYALSVLSVAACFLGVWKLGLELLLPRQALLGLAALQGSWFFGFMIPEFNHNVALLPCWSFAALAFARAVRGGGARHWVAFGACLGLGFLTKYTIVLLGAGAAAYLIADRAGRRTLRTPGPYLALAAFAAIIAPHLLWAVRNGMPGVAYMGARTHAEGGPTSVGLGLLGFLGGQALAAAPAALVFAPVFARRADVARIPPASREGRKLLAYVLLGPLAALAVVVMAGGLRLRHTHGTSLLMFAGLGIAGCVPLKDGNRPLRLAFRVALALGAGWCVAAVVKNVAGPYRTGRASRIHFPGVELARAAEGAWHARHAGPLPAVGGPWWLAGNVTFHSADRPPMFGGGYGPEDFALQPLPGTSLDAAGFRRSGGVILWAPTADGAPPAELVARFPVHERTQDVVLSPCTWASVAPVRISMAVVPPGAAGPASSEQSSSRPGEGR